MSKEKLSIDSGIFDVMRGQIDAALTAAIRQAMLNQADELHVTAKINIDLARICTLEPDGPVEKCSPKITWDVTASVPVKSKISGSYSAEAGAQFELITDDSGYAIDQMYEQMHI